MTIDAVKKKPREGFTPNKSAPIANWRLAVQVLFAALCVWIGLEFHFFVGYLESGGELAVIERPPGVDGFLPISSLMSLYYLLLSGSIHTYHPAGLFILGAVFLMSLVFGKSFCSWMCPVGLLSELLGDFGKRLTGWRGKFPNWLDWPLRSPKYLLLGFFVYSIFFLMNEASLKQFLDSPYNLVSDVKMYYFFANITRFSLIVLAVLFAASIFVRNFWCRFLCPYGALLGITSLLSPQKIKRNAVSCIDCGKCAKVCPSHIKVDKVKTVFSDECTSCLECLDACPVADTLDVYAPVSRRPINKRWIAVCVVGLFVAATGIGMLTGNWQNDVSTDTYIEQQKNIELLGHPTSTRDVEQLREEADRNLLSGETPDSKLRVKYSDATAAASAFISQS